MTGLGTGLENGRWCRCEQENSGIGSKMRQKRRTRNSCTHDQWYKITVSCKQRISSARLMAAWVAVRASRVLHKQWDSNFGLVEQTNRVNRPRIDEMEIGESGGEEETILLRGNYESLISQRYVNQPPNNNNNPLAARVYSYRINSSKNLENSFQGRDCKISKERSIW